MTRIEIKNWRQTIKVVLIVLITAIVTGSFLSACGEDDETPIPVISSFTPESGIVGSTVTISGLNFSETASENVITFNGVAATVVSSTTTEIIVTVPAGATTGKITVAVNGQTTTSTNDFTVTTSSTDPAISGFTPASGPTGTSVTITGTNFSTTVANNIVQFNGVAATVTSATETTLTVTVPAAATTGKISVAVGSITATSTAEFTVTTNSTACNSTNIVEQVVCLANAFKATLSTSQIATLEIALNLTNAKRWSNLPCGVSCRNGLAFSTLSATQLAAAKAVIAAASGASSDEGYSEFSQINAADDVLAATGGSGYSSGNYIIAFLGSPSTTGKWMLQFGGHHYAQNITYNAGGVISATPSHQGIEPKSWTSGTTTYAPMTAEHDGMANMLASFTTAELSSAKISGSFSDVLMVPGSTSNSMPSTKLGIKVSSLSVAAQAKVLAAMAPWLKDLDGDSYTSFNTLYANEIADTYVSYASNTAGVSGNAASFFITNTDYVRIDGPSIWIEFICQTGVVYPDQIHYHSVMRDHSRDYIGL